MLSKGRQSDALPPPSRLEAAVRNLSAARDHRALIGFVERWSTYQEPPAMARLAEARAFLSLAQVDRAWIRIQDLVQQPDASPAVLALAARVYLARGWSNKAREVLRRALSDAGDDPEIQRLWDRAAQPQQTLRAPSDADLRGVDDPDEADRLVMRAAEHLTRGQRVVARGILERVLQVHPEHARASDLIWALEADLTAEDATLTELTDRYAPVTFALDDFVDENTESITQETLKSGPDTDESGTHAFPSLFRGAPAIAPPEDEWTDEVTQTLRHEAGPRPLSTLDDTLPSNLDFEEEGGDTRIVRVRGKDGSPEQLHKAVGGVQGFDLEAYRREMGVAGFDPSLEEEDDALVVLTGRERPTPRSAVQTADPTQSQIGREVAHLMSARPVKKTRKPPGIPELDPDPAVQERASVGTPASLSDSAEDPERDSPRRSRALWPWLLVLAAILAGAVGALTAAGLMLALW